MPLRSAAVSVDTYLDAVRARLAADGCAVTTEMLGPIPVTVGYKGEFKALTKVHVFTVVAGFGRVDEATVRRFTDDAANLAKSRKGQWRGAQSGVLVLPVLVSPAVDPGVVALMRKAYRLNPPWSTSTRAGCTRSAARGCGAWPTTASSRRRSHGTCRSRSQPDETSASAASAAARSDACCVAYASRTAVDAAADAADRSPRTPSARASTRAA